MKNVGRNDPCTCGSGKKLRKCCGSPAVFAAIERSMREGKLARAHFESRFGKVKDIVHADFHGSKFVGIGSRLLISNPKKPWRTFPDFLEDFLKGTMGREWWTAEVGKQPADRHPLVQLAHWSVEHRERTPADAAGIVEVTDDGASVEFVLVAYDLYVVRHHMLFNRRILSRLRDRQQYHGARIELAAAATFLRAGFTLEMENEKDGSKKHPEFIAVEPSTGFRVAVEAKRRHRSEHDVGIRLGIDQLVRSAVEKVGTEAFALYLELNAPPLAGRPLAPAWMDELSNALNVHGRVPDSAVPTGYSDVVSVLLVTNRRFLPGEPPVFQQVVVVPIYGVRPLPQRSIDALRTALAQTRSVPNSFDEGVGDLQRGMRPPRSPDDRGLLDGDQR